ncbi:protein involved in biosynthesis of mitomycin antibiotics/polyketide fumonisin [Rhodobacteraceae bacterium HIMB11]|nr:protein involved in biosynthesis of mitomycin antibiotics/polyketide fumonisin [Rhodobacteraceae bacterium HIMB11]
MTNYGVDKTTNLVSPFALEIEEIKRNGYTVLKDVLNRGDCARLSENLDDVKLKIDHKLAQKGICFDKDANNVRCPLAYDESFIQLALNDTVVSFCREVLGKNIVLLMQNGVINAPDTPQFQSNWHRDLNYQHFTSSIPLALNFLFCLDDFTRSNGATRVLPGTHLIEEFPSEKFIDKYAIDIECKAGDVIILDAMLFHASGKNSTHNQKRRGINHVVGKPFFAQQLDIPTMIQNHLHSELDLDPGAFDYLGYRWRPSPSYENWVEARLK